MSQQTDFVYMQEPESPSGLGSIFKPKAGGTQVGNFLRDVFGGLTGGLIGGGAGKLTQKQIDAKTMSDEQFYIKYGTARDSVKLPNFFDNFKNIFDQKPTLNGEGKLIDQIKDAAKDVMDKTSQDAGKNATKGALQSYWWVIALPFGLIIFLLIWVVKKTSKKNK